MDRWPFDAARQTAYTESSVSCLHHSSCVGIHAMNRRDFIHVSAAVSAAAFCHPRTFAQNNPMSSVRLTVRTDRLGNKIGDDFTGLSAAILEF